MRKIFFLCVACLCLLLFTKLQAQQCGNCKVTPSVASYDLDVQVKQPQEDDKDLQSWKQLFWLARHANSYLFQQNKNCVRFIQPAYDDGTKQSVTTNEGVELAPLKESSEIMKVGEIVANVPGPGSLAYGDYITTGSVTKTGGGYVLHLEIQKACSRKTVIGADVPFQFSSDSKYIEGIAQQAAAKLTPLIDKIKEFELNERKDRKDFALGEGLIKITPAKKSVQPGETTDITVELKDCDGEALGGREIVFTASKNELKIPGTIGGTVTPAKVITDASGKATAKFKMTAGRGQPAIINAHTISATSKNCTDAFLGSAKVDALQAYKVEIDYTLNGTEGMGMNSNKDRIVMTAGDGRAWEVDYSITAFYYPPAAQNQNQEIYIMSDEYAKEDKVELEPLIEQDDDKIEIEPLIQPSEKIEIAPLINYAKGSGYTKESKVGIAHFYYSGSSDSRAWERPLGLVMSPFGAPEPQKIKYENIQSDTPLPPGIFMTFKNNELILFGCELEFPDKVHKGVTGGSFSIEKNDPEYFPVKPKKVTDPNSPYKWEYILNYVKGDVLNHNDGVLKVDKKVVAIATVRIYSAF